MIWINAATTAKRLDDRTRSGWRAVAIIILNRLSYVYCGLFFGSYFGVDISTANELLLVVPVVAMSFLATWVFIELVFVIGTEGSNRFGPDPLARAPGGAPTNSGADQHSVPAFLVHSAGPLPASSRRPD